MFESTDEQRLELRAKLLGSYLEFARFFFEIYTKKEFIVSQPTSRESHHITIARALTQAFRLELPHHRLIINVPPGHGKSVMVSLWVAWAMAHYPDSNFLYTSYSADLAAKHTAFIKSIMTLSEYGYLFDVYLRTDSRSKERFSTLQGGTICAFGTDGSITGQDAGLPGQDRFTGAIIMDDPHKPNDIHSDLVRNKVKDNYDETISQRQRDPKVPIIFIGQRLHEDDLAAFLLNGNDIYPWSKVILKSLDDAGNALYPEVVPREKLLLWQQKKKYVFSSQHQQDPIPSGDALFNPADFVILDEEPNLKFTFITADTAETSKTFNDSTVFSFWGMYNIEHAGQETENIALHWIDCVELKIEPRLLEEAFFRFWQNCMTHPTPPQVAAIEKKSTGTTLVSVLKEKARGLTVREIERTRASGSKSDRFIDMQYYISSGMVSLTKGAHHIDQCLTHMSRITPNDTHAHDDIADTLYDAIKLALIDRTLYDMGSRKKKTSVTVQRLNARLKARMNAIGARNG
jgi:predicted phage terminase large subunit-like protein